jgi:hypothetical protein
LLNFWDLQLLFCMLYKNWLPCKTGLLVEDELGMAVKVSPEELCGLFALFSNQVECVVLSACYSAPQAAAICKHIDFKFPDTPEHLIPVLKKREGVEILDSGPTLLITKKEKEMINIQVHLERRLNEGIYPGNLQIKRYWRILSFVTLCIIFYHLNLLQIYSLKKSPLYSSHASCLIFPSSFS